MKMIPYSVLWEQNPEPDKEALSPAESLILDTEDATADAYLWESHNCSEAWLQFDGDVKEVVQ